MSHFMKIATVFLFSLPLSLGGCLTAPEDDGMDEPLDQAEDSLDVASGPCALVNTPPEYQAPVIPAPSYPAPHYGAPQYTPPIYRAPVYRQPTYQQQPGYPSYPYQQPYGGAEDEEPSSGAPTYTAPTYPGPTFQGPVYQAPIYQAPIYLGPGYHDPGYAEYTVDQPGDHPPRVSVVVVVH